MNLAICTFFAVKSHFVLHYNSSVRKYYFFVILALISAGCGVQEEVNGAETPTASIMTSTLAPSPIHPPSQTPLPPGFDTAQPEPPTPTLDPVEGVASTQVNVRAEPSTAGEVLGILPPNSRVEIVGKDPGGNWWQVLYPPGKNGKAWVAIDFVTPAEAGEIPVVADNELIPENGVFGTILQQVNIRSGPGTDFNSLGTLKPNDSVTVTGKDADGAWLQINFESGPEGKGWVNAAFVQANGVEALPIVAEGNVMVGTGTPTTIPPQAAATILPARADGDSAVAPAVNVSLTASGTRSFQYSSDVSSPEGDAEDWIQFTTFTQNLKVELECEGSESYMAELLQNNSVVQNLVCGKIVLIRVPTEAVYAVHFQSSPAGGLQYTRFTLRVEGIQ